MKERVGQSPDEEFIIEVQRLTKKQMIEMGLVNKVPEGEIRVVALRKEKDGEILQAIVMENVDEKRFLFGEDEYFDQVLEKARSYFNY